MGESVREVGGSGNRVSALGDGVRGTCWPPQASGRKGKGKDLY